MSATQIHFGRYVTIDGLANCPVFTFSFNHGLDGKQYVLQLPDRDGFLFTYTTTYEDIEVGAGLLEIYSSEHKIDRMFEVQFGHDGDPRWEIWGFSLQELIKGDQCSMSDVMPGVIATAKGTSLGKAPFDREAMKKTLLVDLEADIADAIEQQNNNS